MNVVLKSTLLPYKIFEIIFCAIPKSAMEVRKRQNISNMSGSGDSGEFRSGSPESKGAKIDRSFTHCIILSFLIVISALVIPLFFVSHLPEFMKQPAQKISEAFALESKAHIISAFAGPLFLSHMKESENKIDSSKFLIV